MWLTNIKWSPVTMREDTKKHWFYADASCVTVCHITKSISFKAFSYGIAGDTNTREWKTSIFARQESIERDREIWRKIETERETREYKNTIGDLCEPTKIESITRCLDIVFCNVIYDRKIAKTLRHFLEEGEKVHWALKPWRFGFFFSYSSCYVTLYLSMLWSQTDHTPHIITTHFLNLYDWNATINRTTKKSYKALIEDEVE